MKILVIGGGGREHAICKKLSESPKADKLYCAPGNAGISEIAQCVPIGVMEFEKLAGFVSDNSIDLTVVGMDDPLAGGIVDVFESKGLKIFGPRKAAAKLESSKAFSKELMKKYDIPTAGYQTFTDPEEAIEFVSKSSFPLVLKADGPALGKGVLICKTKEEAVSGVNELMVDRQFGDSGSTIVVEEFLEGKEVSVLSFVDGKHILTMSSSQDYKRAGDGDTGLNTGGMGNVSPNRFYTDRIDEFCRENIYQKTVDAMSEEGREFRGVIFFGLILTESGPKVLEYNARFGDPETQVILPRMENDLVDVILACIDGTLDKTKLIFSKKTAVCVVLASGGYPLDYEKGKIIKGLELFSDSKDSFVFHAGTTFDNQGHIVTNGGRVLAVTAMGKNQEDARQKAYAAAEKINFEKKYFRHDIAKA